MIRQVFVLLVLVCLCPALRAQQNTDKQMAGLKGPVHRVVKGWIESDGKRVIDNVTTYNRKGNKIEVVQYATDPFRQQRLPLDKVVSTFAGLTKTERTYKFTKPSQDSFPAVVGIVVNGKVQTPPAPPPVRKAAGAGLQQTLYKLDAKGNWAEKSWYDGRVKVAPLLSRYVYRWNENGLLEEALVFEADGSQRTRITHKYDANGIEIEYAEYDVSGALRMKNTYSDFTLDKTGNWIARRVQMFYVRRDGTPVNTGQNEYREITYYPASK